MTGSGAETFSASLMRGSCSSGAVKMTAMGSSLDDRGDAGEIAGVHDVALVDHAEADAAGERRP